VTLYTPGEYPRVSHAKKCRIKASFGMPIINRLTKEAVAVVEVASTSNNLAFTDLMTQLCSSLSRVGLKSHNMTRFGDTLDLRPTVRALELLASSKKKTAESFSLSIFRSLNRIW
jgi:hypothetical protein